MGDEDSSKESCADLIAELARQGIKHTPESIVSIARDETGKVIFLETGTAEGKSGLSHILKEHGDELEQLGLDLDRMVEFIMQAVIEGVIVGNQVSKRGLSRPLYEIVFAGMIWRVAVTVADNGYIVGANSASRPVSTGGEVDVVT